MTFEVDYAVRSNSSCYEGLFGCAERSFIGIGFIDPFEELVYFELGKFKIGFLDNYE